MPRSDKFCLCGGQPQRQPAGCFIFELVFVQVRRIYIAGNNPYLVQEIQASGARRGKNEARATGQFVASVRSQKSKDNAPARKIIGFDLDQYGIAAGQSRDCLLACGADNGDYILAAIKLDPVGRIRKDIADHAWKLYQLFLRHLAFRFAEIVHHCSRKIG